MMIDFHIVFDVVGLRKFQYAQCYKKKYVA